MRFWRARNRNRKSPPPPKILEFTDFGLVQIRDPHSGEDLSKMIVGGSHLISPETLQKKSRYMMQNAPAPSWRTDPSYWWRRKK